MERGRATFYVLSGLLLGLLLLQATGYMGLVDTRLDSVVPHMDGFLVVFLTETGGMVAFLIALLFFVGLDVGKTGHLGYPTLRLILSSVLTLGIVALLKVTFQTPRPNGAVVSLPFFLALRNVDSFAFPSGHTARASLLASYLHDRFPRFSPLWWAYAVGIALSRLLLHVHWFGDVLFSLLLGPWAYLLLDMTKDEWLPAYRRAVRALGLGVFDVERFD